MHGWLEDKGSYYPGLFSILAQGVRVVYHLLRYRTRTFSDDARVAVVVLDVIDAYETLFTTKILNCISNVLSWADSRNATVVFTQWIRRRPCSKACSDEVDRKAHWSMFVPEGQSSFLVQPTMRCTCVGTRFPDAFAHSDIVEAIGDCTHIVLVGAWLESCVIHTARTAMTRNMDVTIVRGACSGHAACRPGALYTLQDMYATVVDEVF